ncbi:ty3-gypsy retrotransposon protein [Tanacetum coccineum]|uniref:Ty3-gypsy retrotransposon protein n=1 Tax=Tanacetum coccineum TaxID=301880 RepID=A0ABQ5FZM9_9ASTR
MLPKFDGTSPLDWLFQADQYFTFYNIPLEQRVALASFHFQGDALSWYKYMHNNQLLGDWATFTRALELRFGPSLFENHQATLFKLKQTGSVAAYQTEFERLSNCVVGLPTTALLSCFISGLRSDIQQEIAVSNPTQTTTIKPTVIPPAILPKLAKQTTSLPTRRLSPEEMQTRRSQLPLPIKTEALTNLEDHSYDTQPLQFLALSTAALHDTTCPLAIRITGYINGHTVTVLVDSGSSHDIMDHLCVFEKMPRYIIGALTTTTVTTTPLPTATTTTATTTTTTPPHHRPPPTATTTTKPPQPPPLSDLHHRHPPPPTTTTTVTTPPSTAT